MTRNPKTWSEYEDLPGLKDKGKFSRSKARKVKRDLRRLAFFYQ